MGGDRVSAQERPFPLVDERSRGYWEAAARHVLAIARCPHCGVFNHPPEDVCAHCGAHEPHVVFEAVSGRGVIKSWTTVRQALLPGFGDEVPYLLVDVELAEQQELRLIGRLLDGPDAPVRLGAPVRVAFEDVGPDLAVPAFVLEPQS
jgi:uncharacterized OB-fold protein